MKIVTIPLPTPMPSVSPFSWTSDDGKCTCVDSLSSPTLIKCFNENASPLKIDRV